MTKSGPLYLDRPSLNAPFHVQGLLTVRSKSLAFMSSGNNCSGHWVIWCQSNHNKHPRTSAHPIKPFQWPLMIMKSQWSKCSICSQRRADGEETAGRSHEVLQQAGETRKFFWGGRGPVSGTFKSGYTVNARQRYEDWRLQKTYFLNLNWFGGVGDNSITWNEGIKKVNFKW